MAQQTAVEWLLRKLKDYANPIASIGGDYLIRIPKLDMVNIILQSKALEKEQIENAFNYGNHNKQGSESQINNGKDYYNETYNKSTVEQQAVSIGIKRESAVARSRIYI